MLLIPSLRISFPSLATICLYFMVSSMLLSYLITLTNTWNRPGHVICPPNNTRLELDMSFPLMSDCANLTPGSYVWLCGVVLLIPLRLLVPLSYYRLHVTSTSTWTSTLRAATLITGGVELLAGLAGLSVVTYLEQGAWHIALTKLFAFAGLTYEIVLYLLMKEVARQRQAVLLMCSPEDLATSLHRKKVVLAITGVTVPVAALMYSIGDCSIIANYGIVVIEYLLATCYIVYHFTVTLDFRHLYWMVQAIA